MGRQQWQNGPAVALAEGLIEKRIRIGTKSNCKSDSAYCLATGSVHRADRSGPLDDGNQTCGVMIHKEQLFGGEQASLIFRISMCNVLSAAHLYIAGAEGAQGSKN